MTLRTAVVVLCVAFGVNVAFFAFYVVPKLQTQDTRLRGATEANARSGVALCVLRADLQSRVDGSIRFLSDHPTGVPGIPARTIRSGIANQQRTIQALSVLKCPKP